MQANIFNIQRFSIHDGEGIRTTIFFKGCPLSCLWCHNPESLSKKRELMTDVDKCTGCGQCVSHCESGALSLVDGKIVVDNSKCVFCGNCTFYCINQVHQVVGTYYDIDDIYKKAIADKVFFDESNGGVTLSGGEPIIQIDFVEELAKRLYKKNINVNIDTSGAVDFSNLERIAKYTETFLYDIKHTDKAIFDKFIGGGCDLVLENLRKLSKIHNNIIVRMPIIEGVNATEEHVNSTIQLVCELGIQKINLLVYHNISAMKYKKLGKRYFTELMSVPSDEKMSHFKKMFNDAGIAAQIGG